MAKTIKLSGISKSDGTRVFCIEPDWWDVAELQSSTNFHWVDTNETGSYVDHDADVSAGDAQKLHHHFKQKLIEKIAYNIKCRDPDAPAHRADSLSKQTLCPFGNCDLHLAINRGLVYKTRNCTRV